MNSSSPLVTIVSSTRLSKASFWQTSYLGRSLSHIPIELRPRLVIHYANHGKQGLSEIYNLAIDRIGSTDILILVHDDVYIHDWFIVQRCQEAMRAYDVAGVAGSLNPDLRHPSWGLAFDANLNATGWQPQLQRSGAVNHSNYANANLSIYGPTPHACRLLDGVLLAMNVARVRAVKARFDEAFKFHLYDLDFCRSATAAGLRLGTWPIAITHGSTGRYDTNEFRDAARTYMTKWL